MSVQNYDVNSIFWVNEFSCLDTLMLFAKNFTEHSRVPVLLKVKFTALDCVYKSFYGLCKCIYVSSLKI